MAQPIEVESEPEGDYLLEVTREWSGRSPLGDLRKSEFSAQDIELRLWGGYGIGGTRGIILRRSADLWSAFAAEVEGCYVTIPDSLQNDQSTWDAFQEQSSFADCPGEFVAPAVPVDTVIVVPLALEATAPSLWSDLVAAGVLSLPPQVDRDYLMIDGHTYVLEVRVGDTYRASSIEAVEPEVEADRQIQHVARLLRERLGVGD